MLMTPQKIKIPLNTQQMFRDLKNTMTNNEKKFLKENNVIEGYKGINEFNRPTYSEFNLNECTE